ncbi:gliding motility-associated-like protein [Gillisia mitskevichiae]|uniref:Gliding motility-associated-like protein n=1 Tax=Gillisia mitskevichiae TaxID=270921 RepID=A0A495PVH7_9FLAO|nr:T9SS type B sorting domain-containing protein [Gillisia mitskevichiae]RKS53478.1 gliding motility-associated-like protein [Gillisia mitskevichiae]
MRHPFPIVTIFLLLLCQQAVAQKEAGNWYFGDHAGISFNSGSPVALQDGKIQTIEGATTISDRNGNLLFYTEGITVYDRNHNIMQNGTGLKGNVSSTQSAIVVPRPSTPGRYYIFTVDKPDYFRLATNPIEGVHYSEVDMFLNNGNGAIIEGKKNIHLVTYNPNNSLENEFKSSEKISAVISGDCVSYWVVTQFTNKFYSFNVSAAGVNTNPIISTLANNFPPLINDLDINVTAAGYLKISPNGKKMAAAYAGTTLGSPRSGGGTKSNGKVFLYDFDDLTGKVTNEQLILLNTYPYGVEFSPESTKLYATANTFNEEDRLQSGELYQFDLNSTNVFASKTLINSSNNVAGALQLAIDGKIYRAGYPMGAGAEHHSKLSVINNPEELGTASNYTHNSFDISPRDVKLGLPPFVQSLFNSDFDVEELCFRDATLFTISGNKDYDTVTWEFGDGATSTLENPTHTYSQAGVYTVSLTKNFNGIPLDPVCKEITIVEIPQVPNDFELSQCDTQDNNPTDGITEFNLQLAKDYLTSGNNSLQIFFYVSQQAAQNDALNENALNNIYRNTQPNETLYAKVTGFGSECFNITSIKLKTTTSVNLNPSPASGCDLGDGTAEFNFATIEAAIISELALNNTINLSFHADETDASLGENPFPENYISTPKTVYIRANSDDICYGFGQIDLQLTSFPKTEMSYEFEACTSQFPIKLGEEILLNNPQDYSFIWSTGENTSTILVEQGGIYSLRLEDPDLGCGRTILFNVIDKESPIIQDVQIENNGVNSQVTVTSNITDVTVLYALDDINGPYQTDPVFRDVPGGTHIIYIKGENDCDISMKEIVTFGFPSYFTPNNDGIHDHWKPQKSSDPNFQIIGIYIYDRYGKLLKQLDPNGKGWDGTFNGHEMPSDDYWFKILLSNGKEFGDHLTLKR